MYRENFKVIPIRKGINTLFALKQKYKDENNDVMHLLVKLFMNSSYGGQNRKEFQEKVACKSEIWMMSEFGEKVSDYWRILHGNYIVKMVDDKGLEGEVKKTNKMPFNLGAFVLSKSKRIMNNFIYVIDTLNTNFFYYTENDSL